MTYEVGYKKPPKQNQFKKNQSGNPKGRPKASVRDSDGSAELWTMVRKVTRRKVSATQGGKTVKIPAIQALLSQTLNDALRGDTKARAQFLKLLERADLAAFNGQVS